MLVPVMVIIGHSNLIWMTEVEFRINSRFFMSGRVCNRTAFCILSCNILLEVGQVVTGFIDIWLMCEGIILYGWEIVSWASNSLCNDRSSPFCPQVFKMIFKKTWGVTLSFKLVRTLCMSFLFQVCYNSSDTKAQVLKVRWYLYHFSNLTSLLEL